MLTCLTAQGLSDAPIQLISGHTSKKSLEFYQHLSLDEVGARYQRSALFGNSLFKRQGQAPAACLPLWICRPLRGCGARAIVGVVCAYCRQSAAARNVAAITMCPK